MRSMVEGACGGSVRSDRQSSVAAHAPSTALLAQGGPPSPLCGAGWEISCDEN